VLKETGVRFPLQRIKTYHFLFLISIVIAKSDALSPTDPPINTLQCQGVTGFDFSKQGINQQIALFVINSNTITGFDVIFEFANTCQFKSGSKAISMTSLLLNKVSGTLGIGLLPPVDVDVLHHLSGGNQYIWDPGTGQTSETVNYIVELKASWTGNTHAIAGFYFETISATIRAGL
jgi:hypothetical protein